MICRRAQILTLIPFLLLLVGCSQRNETPASATAPVKEAIERPVVKETSANLGSFAAKPVRQQAEEPETADGEGADVEVVAAEMIEVEIDEELLFEEQEELLYVRCKPEEAETILVVRVMIPTFKNDHVYRFPFRRKLVTQWAYPSSLGGRSGCGEHFASMTNFGISEPTDTSIQLEYSYSWSSEETRGKIKEVLPITFGRPWFQQTDRGANIFWTFEMPEDADADTQYW